MSEQKYFEGGKPRQTKREQVRHERQRRQLFWNSVLIGTALAAIALVIWYTFATSRPGVIAGEIEVPDEGAGHVNDGAALTYAHYPPSSGKHYSTPAEWGVYTTPISEGLFVHNLEHGGVVFLYNCPEACPELEQQFTDLFRTAPPDERFNKVKILITPYDAAKMDNHRIIALAWGKQLNLDQFDEVTLLNWYRRYVNEGPELVP